MKKIFYLLFFIITISVVVSLTLQSFAGTLSTSMFPSSLSGLPLVSIYPSRQNTPCYASSQELVSAGYSSGNKLIAVNLIKFSSAAIAESDCRDCITMSKQQYAQYGVSWTSISSTTVSGYPSIYIMASSPPDSLYMGLFYTFVNNYAVTVVISNTTSISASELKSVCATMITKLPTGDGGPVCGNKKCESGESCSNCSTDCGACEVPKKADGEFCNQNEECKSGNCQNYRCCVKGKNCCFSHYHCGLDDYCDQDRHYCLPAKPVGQKCIEDAQCLSNNCGDEAKICCEGQTCCINHSDCRENEYCQQETYYCRYKWLIGDDCGDYGSAMCKSGYCDSDTWTCAEKPEFIEESYEEKEEAAKVPTQIALSLPQSVSLKRGQVFIPLITIENKSMEEVGLGNEIQIENSIPAFVEINKTPILVFKKKLLPREKASVAAQNHYDMIEKLTLTGKTQGSGEIIVKVVYFYKNEARWLEKKISVQVSREHVQKEETATALFKEEMILDEKRGEHIFVEPADSSDYQVTRNAWQEAQEEINKHLNKLKGDFQAMIEPEIVTFFRTMEDLSEAKTSREITETAIRAAAPPIIMAAVDFVNLLDAVEMQKKQERILLEHFGGTEYTNIPTHNEQGQITGYSKAIIRQEDGKTYAIKIGDL